MAVSWPKCTTLDERLHKYQSTNYNPLFSTCCYQGDVYDVSTPTTSSLTFIVFPYINSPTPKSENITPHLLVFLSNIRQISEHLEASNVSKSMERHII